MVPPVINIRGTASPHLRIWLGPAHKGMFASPTRRGADDRAQAPRPCLAGVTAGIWDHGAAVNGL